MARMAFQRGFTQTREVEGENEWPEKDRAADPDHGEKDGHLAEGHVPDGSFEKHLKRVPAGLEAPLNEL